MFSNVRSMSIWKKQSTFGMFATLFCFTVYAVSLLHAKPVTNDPEPNNFQATFPTTPPKLLGCVVDGKFYSPGEDISSGIDKDIGWCYGTYCSKDGNVIAWDNPNCVTTTSPPSTTTAAPTEPKTTIPQTTTPPESTTPPTHPTTPKPPSTVPTTISTSSSSSAMVEEASTLFPQATNVHTTFPRPSGCEYEGKFYALGTEISRGSDDRGWCYRLICSEDGNITPWDDFNCGTTTPNSASHRSPPTTKSMSPETTPPKTSKLQLISTSKTTEPQSGSAPETTRQPGCEYEGNFYSPGTSFGKGNDGEGWCFGLYCDYESNVIPLANFKCDTSTSLPSTTAPFPTTTLPPLTNTLKPLGCEVDGKFYSPGEEISSRIDKKTGLCFATYCGKDGNVISWDNFDCLITAIPTTPEPTTSTLLPKTASSHVTTPEETTATSVPQGLGCEYEGKFYAPGAEISKESDGHGGCSGLICSYDGNITPWDDLNCDTITSLPTRAPHRSPATTTPSIGQEDITLQRTTPKFTKSKSSTPQTNKLPTNTPRLPGCEYEGNFYSPGEYFGKETDAQGWCYGFYCDYNGNVISWDDSSCGTTIPLPSTTTSVPTRSKTSTPQTTTPQISTTPPTTAPAPTTALGCVVNGKFYSPGEEISSEIDNEAGWCHGTYCGEDGTVISWDVFNCVTTTPPPSTTTFVPTTPKTTIPRTTTPRTTAPVTTVSRTVPSSTPPTITKVRFSPKTSTTTKPSKKILPSSSIPKTLTTRGSLLLSTPTSFGWCFFEGKYYENGDIISSTHYGWNWYTGWYCNDGKVDSWTRHDTIVPSSTPSVTSLQCYYRGIYYNEGETVISFEGSGDCDSWYCSGGVLVPTEGRDCGTTKQTNPPTTSPKPTFSTKTVIPEPSKCLHEGRYYEEGDLTLTGNIWCSGLICKDGKMILWDNCEIKSETTNIPDTDVSKATDSKLTQSTTASAITKPTSDSTTTTKPSEVPLTHGPEPSRCFHEGRYYEDGDLALRGNNWCSGFICKDGKMILWENCNVTLQSTKLPITDSSKITESEPSVTVSPISTTNQTSEVPTKPQDITTTSITNLTTQTKETTKPPELDLCLHEGKYYEEGDIIPRDFSGNNWCSGWYCKGGRLIPVDCGDSISKEDTPSPKTTSPPITRGPKSSLCYHKGKYYEDGDLAMSRKTWCSGLICNDGVMISWDNCKVKLESTKSPQVSQIPTTTIPLRSTSKPPEGTPTIPRSSTETLVTAKVSPKVRTKTSNIHLTKKESFYTPKITPDIIAKSPDTTAKTSVGITSIPATTTKVPDSTTIFSDSTTGTTDIPTKLKQTTPTQPPQTTKPEQQKCLYEGAYYPPGEVTQGVLEDGRCYGVLCDISGVIIQWVTTTCTNTEPPTTEIKNTLPGCVYNDKYYPPGRISRLSDGTNWCLDVICTEEGKIVSVNNLNCDEKTTPKPTTAATTKPESMCLYNGMIYSPGVISEGIEENGWCYKVVCQENGELYLWGDWNCRYSRQTTAPPLKTTSSAPTTCTYNTKKYPVGEITRGEDESGWCYGVTCRNDGQIVMWGSFTCRKA